MSPQETRYSSTAAPNSTWSGPTDGRIRVYANGEPDIKHADVDAQAVIQNHLLRFFVDNSNDETSKGAVSRIRLYNDALTAKKVKRIYQQGH